MTIWQGINILHTTEYHHTPNTTEEFTINKDLNVDMYEQA